MHGNDDKETDFERRVRVDKDRMLTVLDAALVLSGRNKSDPLGLTGVPVGNLVDALARNGIKLAVRFDNTHYSDRWME